MLTRPVSYPAVSPEQVPGGDMPGDKILIGESHLAKAQAVFPIVCQHIEDRIQAGQRTVVSVHGGSGVGKSEIGALLGYYLNHQKIRTYVLSGDNYPHRIPSDNDHQRLLTFRGAALKGLVASGDYTPERRTLLLAWQEEGRDSDPSLAAVHPWMGVYQRAGRRGLEDYLGTPNEIDFEEINRVLSAFHAGAPELWLRRMGRQASEVWYDRVDTSATRVIVLEWTHGNSRFLKGVNLPVLLYSTPEETLEHRRKRARDGAVGSPFTALVLEIEQQQILSQASAAVVVKNDATLGLP